MTWTLDDAWYGLRNLAIGDEEETRIGDMLDAIEPADLRARVAATLADATYDRYTVAYQLAVWPLLASLSSDEVKAGIAAWVAAWDMSHNDTAEEEALERAELAESMFEIYGDLRAINNRSSDGSGK